MKLRNNTHTGRPLGSDGFMSKLEKIFGRRIRPLPVGRPKKQRLKTKNKYSSVCYCLRFLCYGQTKDVKTKSCLTNWPELSVELRQAIVQMVR